MIKLCYSLLLLLVGVTSIQCNKTTDDPNDLPPETQTGAGNFACKINGVVWKYNNPDYQFLDNRPRTNWSFDPNEMGGTIRIVALKYYNPTSSANYDEIINLISDSLNTSKVKYLVKNGYNYGFTYEILVPKNKNCGDFNSSGVNDSKKVFDNSGKLTITKLDLTKRIISGVFNCTINETGCDTLKITDGRFDLKY